MADVICEHALTELCDCLPRRPAVNLDGSLANDLKHQAPPVVDHREAWTLKREPGPCTCTPRNKKHKESYECVSYEAVQAWSELNPSPAGILSDRSKKRFTYMWLCWSQDEEAKRLSGRA